MSDHRKETEFLRHCIRYDDTDERHRLEDRIAQILRDELCVRRAVWLMVLLAALAMAGLGYAAVFMAEYPLNVSQLTARFFIKALCVLGAGSLFCLFGFLILGVMFRKELDQRREACRRLALKVLETRLGQPYAALSSIGVKIVGALVIVPVPGISEIAGQEMENKNEANIMQAASTNTGKTLNVFGVILT